MSARRGPAGAWFLRSFQLALPIAVAFASLWGLAVGCREQSSAPIDRNRPPETFITFAPGDSQTAFYRVDIHWWGSDYDGMIGAFDVAVTESLPNADRIEWHRTLRSDSIITFPVEETREVFGHRFYVRAIDNEGKADPSPCWIFFGAKDNISPSVEFLESVGVGPHGETKDLTSVNPDFPTDTIPTGWGVRFRWRGVDLDRVIDSNGDTVRVGVVQQLFYRLLPIETGYLGGDSTYQFAEYPASFFNRFPQGSTYAFNVRAVDDAGLSGSGTVIRSFIWNQDPNSRIYDPSGVYWRSFLSRGELHATGDTLAVALAGGDALPDVQFTAIGTDPDPIDGVDHSVKSMEWRYSTGAVTIPWATMSGIQSITDLKTGDYIIMVRSQDRLDRFESSPDSLLTYVNFIPRFITHGGDSIPGFDQVPMPGAVYDSASVALGVTCQVCADDRDVGPGGMVRYGYLFVGESVIYTYSNPIAPETPVTIRALHSQNAPGFRPGSYQLRIIVEDNAQPGGADARGVRYQERVIPFTVVP